MKNFDNWNKIKIETDNSKNKFYSVREIWWCRFGLNIGYEQDGKGKWFARPVVIIKSFGKNTCLVAPLTTSKKENIHRINIGIVKDREAKVNISQIRVVDTKRFEDKIGFLEKKYFEELKKNLKKLF